MLVGVAEAGLIAALLVLPSPVSHALDGLADAELLLDVVGLFLDAGRSARWTLTAHSANGTRQMGASASFIIENIASLSPASMEIQLRAASSN